MYLSLQLSLQGVQEVALKRKIIDLNGKLKQQQSVYEGARDERNSYSKTLLDVEAEITKISHDFKSITKLVRCCTEMGLRPAPACLQLLQCLFADREFQGGDQRQGP